MKLERRAASPPTMPAHAVAVLTALIALSVAVAVRFDATLLLAGVAFAALSVAASIRWPASLLILLAAVVPFDDVAQLGEIGSIGRAAVILLVVGYGIPRLGRLIVGTVPLSGWAVVGWSVLSVGWAVDRGTAVDQLATFLQLVALAVLVADLVVHSPQVVKPVLSAYSVSSAILAIVGIATFFAATGGSVQRAAAFAGQNPAQYATVLLPAFVFAVLQFVDRRSFLAAAIAVVTGTGIMLSGTRGVWLSAGFFVAAFVFPRIGAKYAAASLAMVAAVLVIVLTTPGVGEFIAFRAETALSSGGSGRTEIWTVGIAIIAESPLGGSGIGNFPAAFTPELIAQTDVNPEIGTERGPHNLIVSTLGELGIIGGIALLLFIGPLVLRPGWGHHATAVQAGLASLVVSAMFLDIFGNRKPVWLLIGLAIGLAYLRRQPGMASSLRSGKAGCRREWFRPFAQGRRSNVEPAG